MAAATGQNRGLLFIYDAVTKQPFLVDTGAEVSVMPATVFDKQTNQPGQSLRAANGTSIKTYGTRDILLHFTSNTYKWTFVLADVSRALLGADFLCSNALYVDVRGKRLVDATTFVSTPLSFDTTDHPTPFNAFSLSSDEYSKLLTTFPEITTPDFICSPTKHGIEHFIMTKGPPVHARARRLSPDKLSAAKTEFAKMESWASFDVPPVHGPHRCIWYRSPLGAGALVGITGASMMPPSRIDIQCHTYRISLHISLA